MCLCPCSSCKHEIQSQLYCIYLSYGEDCVKLENSVDSDQMLQNVASDQGRHFLPLIQQFLVS